MTDQETATGSQATSHWLSEYENAHAVGRRTIKGFSHAGCIEWLTTGGGISSWGSRGWDMGQWPLQAVRIVEGLGSTRIGTYCEGDTYWVIFPDLATTERYADGLALWYWQTLDHGPDNAGAYTPETMPAEWRGRYDPRKGV